MIWYNALNVLEDVDLKEGNARIRMLYSGLCWSDMHKINYWGLKDSDIIWHELVWKVIQLTKNNVDLRIWDIVAINPLFPCHICNNCLSWSDNLCLEFKAIW